MTTPPDPAAVYPSPLPPASEMAGLRMRYVRWLLAQVGVSDPARYFEIAAPQYPITSRPRKSWCGIGLLAGLIECGITSHRWIDRRGFLFRLGYDAITREPEPGDVALFEKTKTGKTVWHHAGALSLDGHMLTSIDFNATGGTVKKCVRDIRIYTPRPVYYSIQEWVDAAEALEVADTEPPGAT